MHPASVALDLARWEGIGMREALLKTFRAIRGSSVGRHVERRTQHFLSERFGNRALPSSPTSLPGLSRWPAVDVYGTSNAKIVVRADLPGVVRGDVGVQIADRTLFISARRPRDLLASKGRCYRSERAEGDFFRKIRLPMDVVPESATVELADGVLTVVVDVPIAKYLRPIVTDAASVDGERVRRNQFERD